MGSINLFRINNVRKFDEKLREYDYISSERKQVDDFEAKVSLYINYPTIKKKPSWNWIVEEMDGELDSLITQPSGILKIEAIDKVYAVSFGHAFFSVEKYCDKDFGIDFAKRIELEEIKTTTLLSPNSNRNKTVSTFIDYTELEFDSGESVVKLKAKCNDKNQSLFKPVLEMSSSIKFIIMNNSISDILKIIIYVENVLKKEVRHKIPMFSKIKDKEKVEALENSLREKVRSKEFKINLSELEIIGATEIFFSNEFEYELSYHGKKKYVATLSIENIMNFIEDNGFNQEEMLDVQVIGMKEDNVIHLGKVHNLIDYTDEGQKCLLNKGNWMMYNDDFMEYLHTSLGEIECKFDSKYNFTDEIYNEYIEDLHRKDPSKSIDSIKNIYYREFVFNKLRENDGFELFDRKMAFVDKDKIEVMDLYRDQTMFAVKIGNTSEKLSYVIDQSREALKLYKLGAIKTVRESGEEIPIPKVKKVALWIILDTKKRITDADGKVDLSKLSYLIFKTKLDIWKKEVRLAGMEPIVYVNYTK